MTTFQFPIRKADGSPFQDAEQLHKLLEAETSGRYLLSNSGYWHGGIHISNERAPQCVFDEPVRCIADGEVVAYRLNKHYLTSYVGEGLDVPWLKYSTSFCLVRHHYQSPPNPEEGANHGKQNELTFYSLYMHLLPFEEYQHDHPTKRLKVTHGDWPARDVPKGEQGSKILGNIPDNVVFDVIDGRLTPEGYYFSKGRIVKGQVGQQGVGAEVWFASEKDGQPIRNSQGRFRLWDITSRRAKPTYWLGLVDAVVKDPNGLEMYLPPQNKTFGTKPESEPRLPQNYRFRFDSEQAIPVKFDDGRIARIAPCTREVTHTRRDTIPLSFWAFIDDQTVEYPPDEPVHLDTVVVPQAPIPIKAGDPVGFLGLYELPDGAGKKSRHQVHLEVFTCDPKLDAFLNNEAGLKQGKQYLEVLRLQHAIVGRDRETTYPSYLFKDHLFDLKKLPVVKDESGEDCYKVSVLERARTPDTPLRTLDALVRKQSALEDGTGVRVISQHDLRAIGFKVVEQHQRDSCSPLNDESVCQFYAQLNALADVNHDGQVTADELRQTLRNPEFRDRWSKLVVRHHTEWQTPSDGASVQLFRDRLSHNPELLRHECERIDKLVFWDEVAVKLKLPVDGRVSFFHPVEFVGAINGKSQYLDIDKFIAEYKKEHEVVFGWFERRAHTKIGPLDQQSEINLKNLLEMIVKLHSEYFKEFNEAYLAYMLATIRVESYDWKRGIFFAPVQEGISYEKAEIDYGSGTTARRKTVAILNHNTEIGDGYKYRGRGLVQITWKINYEKFKNALGIDFITEPDLALDLENTTRIMLLGMRDGLFSRGNTLDYHLSSGGKNYLNARRIINGTDRAADFEHYATKFEDIILRVQ